MAKLKPLILYYLNDYLKPITLIMGISLGSWLFTLQTDLRNYSGPYPDRISNFVNVSQDTIGFIAIVSLVLMIIVIAYHQKQYKNLSQNGFTRNEMYSAKIITIIILALMSLAVAVIREGLYVVWLHRYFDDIMYSSVMSYVFDFTIILFVGLIATGIASIVHKFGLMKTIVLYLLINYVALPILTSSHFIMSYITKAKFLDVIYWWTILEQGDSLLFLFPFTIMSLIIIALTYITLQRTEITE